MSLVSELKTIADYNPTAYVNNSEPDLDAEHLNKTEQALKRVTDAANDAINALKELEKQKLSLNTIVQTESTATDKVPSSAYLKQALGTINSNLGDVIAQSTYKTSLRSPAKTHTLGIHDNGTAYLDNDKVITNSDFSSAVKTTGVSAGKSVSLYVNKLNDTQNYVQFFVDGVDKGYITFDVSRNIK
ncbi:MAG: hypothetical protein ENTB_04895 [Enterocloster aldenensis]